MSHYDYSGSNRRLSADEVRETDTETQIAIMREWFYDNFVNPDEPMHYMAGEYLYVDGDPYNSYEVLEKEFDNIVPENVIHILAEELYPTDWVSAPGGNYYSDSVGDRPFEQFDESIKNINILLSNKFYNTSSDVVLSMHRLLYANIIIAIEVYLSDTFKNKVKYNNSTIRRFVETTPFFKEQKISISAIYKNMDGIQNYVNTYLTGFPWHKLKKTKNMYEKTFDIKFPEDVTALEDAIVVRNDIMHRNGKTPDGKPHKINETIIKNLIDEAQKFVSCIEDQMYEKSSYTATEPTPSIFDLD